MSSKSLSKSSKSPKSPTASCKHVAIEIDQGEIPLPPTEKSKKTLQKEEARLDRSEHEQKQEHVIYEGFNDKLFGILRALGKRLPENKSTYKKIAKAITTAIDKDLSYPMTVWLNNIEGYEDVLRVYSEENVEKFLEIAPSIPLLDALEIKKNWYRFTPANIVNLWAHFKGLFVYSDTATVVPIDLMTAIQDMTDDLERQGLIDLSKPIDIVAASQILNAAMSGNAKIQAGINQINQLFGSSVQVQEPPTYAKRRDRIDRS